MGFNDHQADMVIMLEIGAGAGTELQHSARQLIHSCLGPGPWSSLGLRSRGMEPRQADHACEEPVARGRANGEPWSDSHALVCGLSRPLHATLGIADPT